ncbi:MAG TPA: cation transporter [Lacipirellulaceae bacterium]|nr:cation transporter [Lacipirellulaceae bacterium]
MDHSSDVSISTKASLRTARTLAYVTVGYNVLEGLISIALAILAGSSALLGFGIDSFVESLSGGVMVWRFTHVDHLTVEQAERRERMAIRLVGVSLIILGGYVMYESVEVLYLGEHPTRNAAGPVIAIVSLIAMPILYVWKRRIALAIESRSLAADAKQTLACTMLSVALLMGTGLHYLFGLWQADPIAGSVIAAYVVREGYRAWREHEPCC